MVSAYRTLLDLLCLISEWICGVALVVLTVIFGWLVYGRYVLNATPTWVEQVSLLLIVLIGFLGASVGVHRGTHLGVTYLRDILPAMVRRALELLAHVIMAVFGAVMMINSYDLVIFKWGSEIPLLGVPEGLRAIPITLCGALTLMYSIGHIVEWLRPDLKAGSSAISSTPASN
ncbi:MAG: TRAP transporter small permease [Granulosicoccus sp.]